MDTRSKTGERRIYAGFATLVVTWSTCLLGSKLAATGLFETNEPYGMVDRTALIVVCAFALPHLVALALISAGLIRLAHDGLLRNPPTLLTGALGLGGFAIALAYSYLYVFGASPF